MAFQINDSDDIYLEYIIYYNVYDENGELVNENSMWHFSDTFNRKTLENIINTRYSDKNTYSYGLLGYFSNEISNNVWGIIYTINIISIQKII